MTTTFNDTVSLALSMVISLLCSMFRMYAEACNQKKLESCFQLERKAFVMGFGVFFKLELWLVLAVSSKDILAVI